MFEFQATPDQHATVLRIGNADKSVVVPFLKELTENDHVGADVTALQIQLATTASRLAEIAPDRSEAGLHKEATGLVERNIKPAFALAVEGQRRAAAEVEARWTALHTPQFPADSSPAVRAEERSWARGLTMPKVVESANGDAGLAASIIEGRPPMSGLPADVFERLRREMAITQLADKLALQNDYRTEPTAADPIGGLVDMGAARAAAKEHIDGVEARREVLSRVPPLLSSVIDAVAVMTGEERQGAFERLTAS